jgi:flagellar protein FlgJ
MAATPVNNAFYADPQSTTALRSAARTQSPAALRETAKQFESLFTGMMLKSMRQATPKDTLMGSDQQDFYQDMFDQQLATQLSKGKGLGLADMLVKQLMKTGVGGSGGASGATGSASVSGAANTAAPAVAGPAASATVKPQAANWPPATHDEFVQALLPAATAAGNKLGVDPQSLIAHAALETNWGKSMPRAADGSCSFNLFGIKAGSGWSGAQTTAQTTEVVNGQAQSQKASFRSYGSPEDCMQDYAKLLGSSSRYSGALGTGADTSAFAGALQRGGYATDPNYANKLTAVAQELRSRTSVPITPKGLS